MKRAILFLYILCMKLSVLGMTIQVINNSGCTCGITLQLNSFSCSINEIDGRTISSKGQGKSTTLEKGKSAMIFLTRNSTLARNSSVSIDQLIVSANGVRSFLGKAKISFPIALRSYKGADVPVFISDKYDPNIALLRGASGFCMRKYMSPRFDRYILELCKN